ncbi:MULTISPECIES: sugar transferase [unclassified Olleya]|jgi:lipopolysaccharide/colanic/teichoic acid biosynthesis glycosyltransferase|uniref:sugar transferase n=1 Tax=unclassified Olleya TaxID=2615019 RepID=UPI0011A2CDBC|nr:sugar transferase [Olleya sp. Hel_I_94]TVZ48091.1 lipopolysaccharide/colanic/teichoic acid biosynthesis glycosyltransferase [Olleya sp. Hel_I_94]
MYKNVFKPFFDFTAALLGLLVFSPIFIIVYLSLAYVNKGNPFFFQTRPGKDGKLFNIIKFKTMTEDKDKNGVLLPDVDRLTNFGKFVRKTSLDELPQLINVIKGDMSIIGPRPLLPSYLELYTEEQKRRHLVKPGITGLAQVKGRNLMKFSERFINDVYYIDNLSFKLDCKIIFMTINSVLFSKSTIVNGQTVDEVDDLGISKNLDSNHFKNNK